MTQFQRYQPARWLDEEGLLVRAEPDPPAADRRLAPATVHSAAPMLALSALVLATSTDLVQIKQTRDGSNACTTTRSSPRSKELLRGEFLLLVEELQEDCAFASSTTEWADHPAFQRILEMGSAAIPLLIEVVDEPGEWVVALMKITGEDPAGRDSWGQRSRMAKAWRRWAEQHLSDELAG
jgi:hypothetical protein